MREYIEAPSTALALGRHSTKVNKWKLWYIGTGQDRLGSAAKTNMPLNLNHLNETKVYFLLMQSLLHIYFHL